MSNDRSSEQDMRSLDPEGWYLEGCNGTGKSWIVHLRQFPFSVGRGDGSDLRLPVPEISRHHAELFLHQGHLGVREFGSTNGTFVNRHRIRDACLLQLGDILHFGTQEFRVGRTVPVRDDDVSPEDSDEDTALMELSDLPKGLLGYAGDFEKMLDRRLVVPHYQPLIRLRDGELFGYELLGRVKYPGLPESPMPLFEIARGLGKEVELSKLFRETGILKARALGDEYELFFNTLPSETRLDFLSKELPRLRQLAPDLPMTMEVHEATITDVGLMRALRDLLREYGMRLAYDDFGAGQARLQELMEVPPDVLKFDIGLIRGIHQRPFSSQQMLRALVRMASDLGIRSLAEGVEVREELEICRDLGFDDAQGYFLGRPTSRFRHHRSSSELSSEPVASTQSL